MKFPSVYEGKGFVSNGFESLFLLREKRKFFFLRIFIIPLSKKKCIWYIFLELDLNCFDKF